MPRPDPSSSFPRDARRPPPAPPSTPPEASAAEQLLCLRFVAVPHGVASPSSAPPDPRRRPCLEPRRRPASSTLTSTSSASLVLARSRAGEQARHRSLCHGARVPSRRAAGLLFEHELHLPCCTSRPMPTASSNAKSRPPLLCGDHHHGRGYHQPTARLAPCLSRAKFPAPPPHAARTRYQQPAARAASMHLR